MDVITIAFRISTTRQYSNLALVLKDLGDLSSAAQKLAAQTLSIFQKIFSPEHPYIAQAKSILKGVEGEIKNIKK